MKVGIIGLGVVGLSFASVLGSKGFSVIGMDSDEQKIEKINSKKSLFFEPKLESFLKNALSTSLEISSDVQKVVKLLLESGIEAVIIHFLHSYKNDVHERRTEEIVKELKKKSADFESRYGEIPSPPLALNREYWRIRPFHRYRRLKAAPRIRPVTFHTPQRCRSYLEIGPRKLWSLS